MLGRSAKPKLLIVEDDEDLQRQLEWAFAAYEVVIAGDRAAALKAMRTEGPEVITLDLGLPPDPDGASEGMATLREIITEYPTTKVIIASGHEARESAQTAIALGAYDFYSKPINIADLSLIVARAFHLAAIEAENRRLAQQADQLASAEGIVTGAAEMLTVLRTIDKVANVDASVMLLGASGTGKELLAKAVHTKSARSRGNFVAINCAAIPEALLESELFGHERGAFTGAVKMTVGKIEMAHGGTLFLDEVGDVPMGMQVKLLRFLQERVIERIGGRKAIAIDARVITATHQDLPHMMKGGLFREDLYFRLAEMVIRIPSLAERPGDPVLLARYFLRRFVAAKQTRAKGFTPGALNAIATWPWTGNIRELENRVRRATIMADGVLINERDLDFEETDASEARVELRVARERADRVAIAAALSFNNGNLSATARDLNISRPMLYELLKTYEITKV